MKRHLILALVLASLTALAIAAAPASAQTATVDFANCAFGTGTTTAPAGEPITLTQTGGVLTGTYGTTLHAEQATPATATIAVTGGNTTVIPLSYEPPQFESGAWGGALQAIPLDPLQSRESVLVTIDQTVVRAWEAPFPGQGFGPFHFTGGTNGDTFESSCQITAA